MPYQHLIDPYPEETESALFLTAQAATLKIKREHSHALAFKAPCQKGNGHKAGLSE